MDLGRKKFPTPRIACALLMALLVSAPVYAQKEVVNKHYAAQQDILEAEKFLAQLPPACDKTSATAKKDGTVNISLHCIKDGKQSLRGVVSIKDGKVIEVK